MPSDLTTRVGALTLKNPLIAAPAEHLLEEAGVRRALAAGVGAVVVKSTNEREGGKDQLQRAEYVALDEHWRPVAWDASAPLSATVATRSGLTLQSFDEWLEQIARLDREAAKVDSYAIASLILSDLDEACRMAKQVDQAGVRALEFNIGTPYASVAAKDNVTTEFDPARVTVMVSTMRKAIKLPLWIKLTGQSERVPDLARAAFDAGADSVVMAGRLLGFIPDVETLAPMLGTSLGVGGFWNLPLTCHWLAASRAALGKDRPLIGINGAQSGLDIARMMLSGASAVAMASPVMLRGFGLLEDSLRDFSAYLAKQNLNAADLIGRAADQRKAFVDMPLRVDNWRRYVPKTT
jgi:dihydroorotate dehydrogenase (NAD+) catalytic subunit